MSKPVGENTNRRQKLGKLLETMDLEISAENYKKRNGFYPSKINADKIYVTRNNRIWYKELDIQLNGKPLGRPTELKKEKLKELKKGVSERNCVEGKFGQAKRWYGLDNIHARLQNTSKSMIGAIVVILNLGRLMQQHAYTFLKYSYKLIYLNVYHFTRIFLKKNQFLESLTF